MSKAPLSFLYTLVFSPCLRSWLWSAQLLSVQEEQEELDQTAQEYEKELQRARDELQCLHEEIGKARARVEDAHGRMGLLKHSIGETYTEITEVGLQLLNFYQQGILKERIKSYFIWLVSVITQLAGCIIW